MAPRPARAKPAPPGRDGGRPRGRGVGFRSKEIPSVWKSGRLRVGAIVEELNRQYVLHGTGLGWDDSANATRAVLLLAAAARVADPLFKPRAPMTATDP